MVRQAAVHELSIIYNLFPTYFHKRVRRDKCNKSVSPKHWNSQKDHNHEEEEGKDSEMRQTVTVPKE